MKLCSKKSAKPELQACITAKIRCLSGIDRLMLVLDSKEWRVAVNLLFSVKAMHVVAEQLLVTNVVAKKQAVVTRRLPWRQEQ